VNVVFMGADSTGVPLPLAAARELAG
jgi:hypothetical protein